MTTHEELNAYGQTLPKGHIPEYYHIKYYEFFCGKIDAILGALQILTERIDELKKGASSADAGHAGCEHGTTPAHSMDHGESTG